MWGIDATAGFTLRDGQVPTFAGIDDGSACDLGIHLAKSGSRFKALGPVRQAVRIQFRGFAKGIAFGVRVPHDHGAQFKSGSFQRNIRVLGRESSAAFLRERKRNDCIECFFGILEEQFLWVRHLETLEELAEALEGFRQRYNQRSLVERLLFQSPRQAHEAPFALEPTA